MIGLIGGYNLETILQDKKWQTLTTKYGSPSSKIGIGKIEGKNIALILRHGEKHAIPPHRINNKANIRAFYDLGVKFIIATAAVGIINPKYKPGDFILPNDFIDFTFQPITFFDKFGAKPAHIFMSEPYSARLREKIFNAAKNNKIKIQDRGVYANMPGPRLETQAELKMLKKLGADMVGMTNAPEIILANELGIKIATIAIATNFTIGQKIETHDFEKVINNKSELLNKLICETIYSIPL